MNRPSEGVIRLRQALKEQEDLEAKANEAIAEKEREKRATLEAEADYYNNRPSVIRERNRKAYREFVEDLKASLLESCLSTIYTQSLGNTVSVISEDTKAFNKSLIVNYIKESGASNLLERMENKSMFLSEMALTINEKVSKILEGVDPEDPTTHHVDDNEDLNFFDSISGDEDVEDISTLIRMRVSRATEDFMQKNIADKYDIKDIMLTTKEKIDGIKSGDEETDEQIAQEQTILMKRAIREKANRPHNVYEQMVINLTEAVLANDELKAKFTTEAGKLDMDSIVEKVNSIYTLDEMVTTMKLETLDEAYLERALSME